MDYKATLRLKFKGVGPHWFVNMIANGHKLTVGKIYTSSALQVASSWTVVTLQETGDLQYSLAWFEYISGDIPSDLAWIAS